MDQNEEVGDDDYMSDDAANRRAMEMMLNGEHPDSQIDKLLD